MPEQFTPFLGLCGPVGSSRPSPALWGPVAVSRPSRAVQGRPAPYPLPIPAIVPAVPRGASDTTDAPRAAGVVLAVQVGGNVAEWQGQGDA